MKNNKGFSLVELLAVLAILGILFVIGITAYSRYKVKARKQGYETMAKSASQAASEYKMDHPSATAVTFDTLHKNGYLSSLNDPVSLPTKPAWKSFIYFKCSLNFSVSCDTLFLSE